MSRAISLFAALVIILLITNSQKASAEARDFAVELSTTVQNSPPRIDFSWRADLTANQYYVFKKAISDTAWGEPIAILDGFINEFSDSEVAVGEAWEYSFRKTLDYVADTLMVPANLPLTFTIFDSYGDGMCCHYGLGSYEVSGPDDVYAEGGEFTFSESTQFVVGLPGDPLTPLGIALYFDVWPAETTWTLTRDDTGAILGNGGPGPPLEFGHILAGIQYPECESRGSLLLLVENTAAHQISSKISRLEVDLICDGYKVHTRIVDSHASVPDVKDVILDVCNIDPELETLLLLGDLPVPYSGNIMGEHLNHQGAWPADLYYGELDGIWTDDSVYNTTASRPENHNVPGDGKFDQTWLPSDVDLQMGRIDLSDMPAFAMTEIELLRHYLDKNHAWRRGQVTCEKRALIDDNFGDSGGLAYAASGWRNFATMLGYGNVEELDYFSTLANESYLWSYGCGGGSYVSCGGVGTTNDFASNSVKTVFTVLFGSYFGDWDNTDNFLRAPLAATGHALTNIYAGRPAWHMHHMAMGFPVGYSTRLTQNNNHLYVVGFGGRQIHIALMGDPTLRMHVVKPAADLTIEATGEGTHQLNWSPSDDAVLGYHIYSAASLADSFERLNIELVTSTSFLNIVPMPGENLYMVRALRLEESGSGTYYNLSGGIIDSLYTATSPPDGTSPGILRLGQCFPNPFNPTTTIEYQIPARESVTLKIYAADGRRIRTLVDEVQSAGSHANIWDGKDEFGRELASGVYCYTLQAGDFNVSRRMILLK